MSLTVLTRLGTPTLALSAVMIGACVVLIGIRVAKAHKLGLTNRDRPSAEELAHRKRAGFLLVPIAFYATILVTVVALDHVADDKPKFGLNAGLSAACTALAIICVFAAWSSLWGRHPYKWARAASRGFMVAAHVTMAAELWMYADTALRYPLVDSFAQHLRLWAFGFAVAFAILTLVLAVMAHSRASDGGEAPAPEM